MVSNKNIAQILICLALGMPLACGKHSESDAASQHEHGHKRININNAILSELDRIEAELGIPALSNKIQAARPYGSVDELVTKNVLTQEQFDKVKDQLSVQDVVLTGEAKDIDYLVKLGLMKGHMIVAGELIALGRLKDAEPHIGHPVEEIYIDVEDQLTERKVPQFKDQLIQLQDRIKTSKNSAEVKTLFDKSMNSIDVAIKAIPAKQMSDSSFIAQSVSGLLENAASEYTNAVSGGKITAAIEYQDSRGFVWYADQLIAPLAAKNPALGGIRAKIASLKKIWPAAVPPEQAVATPDAVTKNIHEIQKSCEELRKK